MPPGRGLLGGVSRLQLLVAGLAVAGVVGATAFAGSLVVAVMTAAGALGGSTSLWVLLALLVTVLVAGLAGAGAAAWLAWLAVAQLRTAVTSRHRRVLYWAYQRSRAFEDGHPLGRVLRPTRVFAARSDRDGPLVNELKRRYVAGDLDEPALEDELARLLGDGEAARRTVRREITVTAADGGDGDATGPHETGESDHERESERA